jgi:hypothetical protein
VPYVLVIFKTVSKYGKSGALGEFLAMKEFVDRGWSVFVPISAPGAVDFFAYNSSLIKSVRVQVKSGAGYIRSRGGGLQRRIDIRHSGKQYLKTKYRENDFDVLSIVFSCTVFLINWPISSWDGVSDVNVSKLSQFKASNWDGFKECSPSVANEGGPRYSVEDMF